MESFFAINKLSFNTTGLEILPLSNLIIDIVCPLSISAINNLPVDVVKYKFFLPTIKPMGKILSLFFGLKFFNWIK